MRKFELVIAGGGLTAARAIKSYPTGGRGLIALLSKESDLLLSDLIVERAPMDALECELVGGRSQ